MYYDKSSRLLTEQPLKQNEIRIVDRLLAHAYLPDGVGSVEKNWVATQAGTGIHDVESLLALYEEDGIVKQTALVQCDCGVEFNSSDSVCPGCSSPVEECDSIDRVVYKIIRQPQEPAYNPENQPNSPDVFISYRRNEASRLAADIYYSLRSRGYSVFLDSGEIPAGADAEFVFLTAASNTRNLILLVSPQFFESPYCQKEIAHAARRRARLLRVNFGLPVPAPPDMTWIDTPNWIAEKGSNEGLTPKLENALVDAVNSSSQAPNADLRREACRFLLEQFSPDGLRKVCNRLPYMTDQNLNVSKAELIGLVLRETTNARIDTLCGVLAPVSDA